MEQSKAERNAAKNMSPKELNLVASQFVVKIAGHLLGGELKSSTVFSTANEPRWAPPIDARTAEEPDMEPRSKDPPKPPKAVRCVQA